jgi:hypothetical protein
MVTVILEILRKIEVCIVRWQNQLLVIHTRRNSVQTDAQERLNDA